MMVTINEETTGSRIYYTSDGSNPTKDSKIYLGETINLTESKTIKAKAVKSGMIDSKIISKYIVINSNKFVNGILEKITYESILGRNSLSEAIKENLELSNTINGYDIIWKTTDSTYIKENGEVIRPFSDLTDKKVELIAKVNLNGISQEKAFSFLVKKNSSIIEDNIVLDYLGLQKRNIVRANKDVNTVVNDLNLLQEGLNGSKINWESSNQVYLTNTGEINRPDSNSEDAKIKLIAKINSGVYQKDKEFDIIIKRISKNDAEAVELANKTLTEYIIKGENESLNNISKDLNLVKNGTDGTSIIWQSENEELVSTSGKIYFEKIDEKKEITLIAWISKEVKRNVRSDIEIKPNDASLLSKKTFTIVIPKYDGANRPGMPKVTRNGRIIILTSATGSDMYYTLDGSDPTDSNNVNRILYIGPFELNDAAHLQTVAYNGSAYSYKVSDYYTKSELGIDVVTNPQDPIAEEIIKVGNPVFDPGGFSSQVPLGVTITTVTPNANIYYTTDGSDPTSADTLYNGQMIISQTVEMKAIAIRTGDKDSDIVTGTFTILAPQVVADPGFTPTEGSYTTMAGITIGMSTETSGADIYYRYTTNGDVPANPTSASTSFGTNGGIDTSVFSDDTTVKIKAIAIKTGYTDSNIISAEYYIDNDPAIVSVEISPSSDITLEKDSTQTFSTVAKDASGNTITGGGTFTYSIQSGEGSINGTTGVYTASTTGSAIILVTEAGGKTDTSGTITIVDTSSSSSFLYNGTTYNGKETVGTGTPETYTDASISITAPTTKNFDADSFFTLEGNVTYDNDGAKQYAWVKVIKGSDTTTYWIGGDVGTFSERIWLRFGSGVYTVEVIQATISDAGKNDNGDSDGDFYDGDILSWSYVTPARYTFTVTNTNSEDGRYIYPSHFIQSDNTAIVTKANKILSDAGKSAGTNQEKAQALHDWVVKYLYYDDASLISGQRKKQDAITVLQSGSGFLETTNATATSVCEGYTSLYNAMLRSQGIRAKAIAGNAGGGLHAWTAVETTDGSGVYKYVDTTWDDPGSNDVKVTNLFQDYFWKDSFSDHTVTDDRPERAILNLLDSNNGLNDFYRYSY